MGKSYLLGAYRHYIHILLKHSKMECITPEVVMFLGLLFLFKFLLCENAMNNIWKYFEERQIVVNIFNYHNINFKREES